MSRKIFRNNYRRLNLFIKQLKYNLVGVEEITPKAKFINITL